MTQIDGFGRDYVRLALEIEKHVEGYVDAYVGPEQIRAEINAQPAKDPAALLDDLNDLRARIPGGDSGRRAHLDAHLRAMECTIRGLAGEEFGYLDEVKRLYDITPSLSDETVFEAAHARLEALLPGEGSLNERYERWSSHFNVTGDPLSSLLRVAHDESRKRTRQIIDLGEREEVTVEMVHDQPWAAYNWYRGSAQSLIQFNTDLPISALRLLSIFAHEAYPGHHTEHVLKERLLYEEKGYAEESIFLLHSPSAVIAEGIANTAAEIIFPGERELWDWMVDVMLPVGRLPAAIPADLAAIAEARDTLKYVSPNVAILFHTGKLTEAQAVDYIVTYSAVGEARARQTFRFIANPLFRSYIFTYSVGYDLIARAAQATEADGSKQPLFLRLLTGQVTPSELARMAEE